MFQNDKYLVLLSPGENSKMIVHPSGSEYYAMNLDASDDNKKIRAVFSPTAKSKFENTLVVLDSDKGDFTIYNLKSKPGSITCVPYTYSAAFIQGSTNKNIKVSFTNADLLSDLSKQVHFFIEFKFTYGFEGAVFWICSTLMVAVGSLLFAYRVIRLYLLRKKEMREYQVKADDEDFANIYVAHKKDK